MSMFDTETINSLINQSNAPVLLENNQDEHIYQTSDGDIFQSISMVLEKTMKQSKRDGLQYWRNMEPAHKYIMEHSRDIGHQTHAILDMYWKDPEHFSLENFDLLPMAHFANIQPLLKQKITNIREVEQALVSKQLGLAGTCDLIADYDGVLSIIDYKTKRTRQQNHKLYDYYLQTACYAMMYHEMTGQKIEQLVIIISGEKHTIQDFTKKVNDYVEPLLERINQYRQHHTNQELLAQ